MFSSTSCRFGNFSSLHFVEFSVGKRYHVKLKVSDHTEHNITSDSSIISSDFESC